MSKRLDKLEENMTALEKTVNEYITETRASTKAKEAAAEKTFNNRFAYTTLLVAIVGIIVPIFQNQHQPQQPTSNPTPVVIDAEYLEYLKNK